MTEHNLHSGNAVLQVRRMLGYCPEDQSCSRTEIYSFLIQQKYHL